MKRYINILLLIVFVSSTFMLGSCFKKGPNDPFISFRARKARMTGDWKIKDYLLETTTDFIDGEKDIYKFTGSADAVSETIGYKNKEGVKDTTWTWSGKVVEGGVLKTERYFLFDKDGKVTYKYHYILSEFYEDDSEEPGVDYGGQSWWADTTRSIERKLYNTGTWNFLLGVDDYKKRERINVVWEYVDFEQIDNIKIVYRAEDEEEQPSQEVNESTRQQSRSYYYNGENTEVWVLDKLKNKELMMYRYLDNNYKKSDETSEIVNTSLKGYEQYDLEQE